MLYKVYISAVNNPSAFRFGFGLSSPLPGNGDFRLREMIFATAEALGYDDSPAKRIMEDKATRERVAGTWHTLADRLVRQGGGRGKSPSEGGPTHSTPVVWVNAPKGSRKIHLGVDYLLPTGEKAIVSSELDLDSL